MKRVILLIGFLLISSHLKAQFYIGGDFGAISYDISDEYIAPHHYENITASILNPALFYLGETNLFFARFGKKVTRLDLARDEGYLATNYLEIENYELEIEYFHKLIEFSSAFDGFLGIAHNGHFTYINRIFRSPAFGNETESHEMGAIAFSVNGLFRYQQGGNSIHYKVGVNVFSIGSRPEVQRNNIDLRVFSWDEYARVHQSLAGYLKISDRFLLKPEYQLKYYTFKEPERFKMLKQSFLVGVFVRL